MAEAAFVQANFSGSQPRHLLLNWFICTLSTCLWPRTRWPFSKPIPVYYIVHNRATPLLVHNIQCCLVLCSDGKHWKQCWFSSPLCLCLMSENLNRSWYRDGKSTLLGFSLGAAFKVTLVRTLHVWHEFQHIASMRSTTWVFRIHHEYLDSVRVRNKIYFCVDWLGLF